MKRERWGSKLGVILAVAGSAVGLGNFLRFSCSGSKKWWWCFYDPLFYFPFFTWNTLNVDRMDNW
jgi:hypothetical protein